MRRRISTFLLLFAAGFLSAPHLGAQTAAEMDALLETQAVTVSAAARFIFEAANLLPPGLSGFEAERTAYNIALQNKWTKASAGRAITLRETAFLTMKAFKLRGGIMYFIFSGPRYAYREMVYRGLIQGKADPAMTVSGKRLLHIIGRTLDFTPEYELTVYLTNEGW